MEAFGARAGDVCANPDLSDEEKEVRIARLWVDYAPNLSAFGAVSRQTSTVETIVSGGVTAAEASGGIGIARNSAWTSGDLDAVVGTTLPVDYALSEATDALRDAVTAVAAARTRFP